MTKLRKGQSIVEVVIATTLITIGIVAALSLANYSARQNSYAKYINDATSYNSQAADWLRSQKTLLGWLPLVAKLQSDGGGQAVAYCLTDLNLTSASFTTLGPGNCAPTDFIPGTILVRELLVDLGRVGEGILILTVTTSWTDKTTHSLPLTLEISQWK